MRRESDSLLIDRIVLGIPQREILIRNFLGLVEAGWTHSEIATQYGMTRDAVAVRIKRWRERHQ